MSDDNTRNEFVVDDAKHHEDLQDLAALKRVKDAISKKKRQIKDKDYLNKHPDLQDLVDAHRTRKIVRKEPDKEGGKIKLELQEKHRKHRNLKKNSIPILMMNLHLHLKYLVDYPMVLLNQHQHQHLHLKRNLMKAYPRLNHPNLK